MESRLKRRVGLRSDTNKRQSFDRFGDDLCQYLLSYLSLEDRFRCECVAKQWQTLIFTTQTDLIYDSESKYKLNIKSLKCVLKKCPNITVIQMGRFISRSTKSVFDLVIKHCHRLHTFCVSYFTNNFNRDKRFTVNIVNKFFAKFAKQLKIFKLSVDVNDNVEQTIVQNMKLCHNITDLCEDFGFKLDPIWPLFSVPNEIIFPKLKEISICFSNEFPEEFEVFVDNYKNQLKVIKVDIDDEDDEYISTDKLVKGLSQMNQLIALHFGVFNTFSVTHLRPIGLQLRQLKCLAFIIYDDLIPNDWTLMLKMIGKDFKQLKRLSLNILVNDLPMNGLVSQRLTHLKIKIRGYDIEDEFWTTLSTNLPKLQYIDIKQKDITDSVLNGLLLVPKLRYVRLKGSKHYTQTGLKNLMDKSSKPAVDIHHRDYDPDNEF